MLSNKLKNNNKGFAFPGFVIYMNEKKKSISFYKSEDILLLILDW